MPLGGDIFFCLLSFCSDNISAPVAARSWSRSDSRLIFVCCNFGFWLAGFWDPMAGTDRKTFPNRVGEAGLEDVKEAVCDFGVEFDETEIEDSPSGMNICS